MSKNNKCCKHSKGGLTIDINVTKIVMYCCMTAAAIVSAIAFSKTYIRGLEISAQKDR